MKSAINLASPDWWLSFLIVLTMAAALAGFNKVFYIAIVLSIIRIIHSIYSLGIKSGAVSWRVQYSFLIIIAFYAWDNVPLAWWLMFIATVVYTFFDKHLVERLLVWLE